MVVDVHSHYRRMKRARIGTCNNESPLYKPDNWRLFVRQLTTFCYWCSAYSQLVCNINHVLCKSSCVDDTIDSRGMAEAQAEPECNMQALHRRHRLYSPGMSPLLALIFSGCVANGSTLPLSSGFTLTSIWIFFSAILLSCHRLNGLKIS